MPRPSLTPAERVAKLDADLDLAAYAVEIAKLAIASSDQAKLADACKMLEAVGCYGRRTELPAPAAIPAATQALHVVGPNLRDQSKGTFHVHAVGCRDMERMAKRDPEFAAELSQAPTDFSTLIEVAEYIYDNGIMTEGETGEDYLSDFHFAPCVNLPVK